MKGERGKVKGERTEGRGQRAEDGKAEIGGRTAKRWNGWMNFFGIWDDKSWMEESLIREWVSKLG